MKLAHCVALNFFAAGLTVSNMLNHASFERPYFTLIAGAALLINVSVGILQIRQIKESA